MHMFRWRPRSIRAVSGGRLLPITPASFAPADPRRMLHRVGYALRAAIGCTPPALGGAE
jgi:hypothetical protein